MVRAQPVVRGTQSCWTGAAMKQNEYIAVPQVMRAARPRTGRARPKEDVMKQLHHASRPQTRYRARPFNSGCHPFEAGRSAVRVRAKNAYLRTWGLSTDGSCSLPSGQPSVRAFQIIGSFNVRRLFSLLADLCAYVLTRASARTAEYFRQFLDPVVSARGIEIKGLGRRLSEMLTPSRTQSMPWKKSTAPPSPRRQRYVKLPAGRFQRPEWTRIRSSIRPRSHD